jgi:hypothetical protein
MKNNPLVGYAAISPESAFMKAGEYNAVVGPSRRAWLEAFIKERGMSGWLIMPIYVNYLYAYIENGGRGSVALDFEAFNVFNRFALARGWEPADTFIFDFNEGVTRDSREVTQASRQFAAESSFFLYREEPGRN